MAEHCLSLSPSFLHRLRRNRNAQCRSGGRSRRHLGSSALGLGVLCLTALLTLRAFALAFLSAPGEVLRPRPRPSTEVALSSALSSAAAAAAVAALPPAAQAQAQAAEASATETPDLLLFLGAGALLAAAVLSLSLTGDGEGVDDKRVVTDYFNNEGFERWSKIYGETEDVNPVQKDIRVGHAETVNKILKWLDSGSIRGKSVCDAGCGTGNLSIPLASRGALVSGSDISSAMVTEAAKRAEASLASDAPKPSFETRDLEAIEGKFDTVCCVDVLIHYPPERLEAMVGNLAKLSKGQLILSFAPKTWYYVALKRLGELFPGKSKTTRAYLHEEETVEKALEAAGFQVTRREMTSTNFYFSRLFEAQPAVTSAS